MTLAEGIAQLPKTDLHCHLDGSMRIETILELAETQVIPEQLLNGARVTSLPTFLQAFDITCSILQSADAIERVAFELAEDAHRENVRHLEVRFAPILGTHRGLSSGDVLRAARKGLLRAEKKYSMSTGLIVCALRNRPPEVSIEAAKLAIELRSDGVVGFDLAHAERGNPAGRHAKAFQIAREGGLGTTVHAGEDFGPESIREAIDLCFAQRIGHGLTLRQDPKLEAEVAERGIFVECCPSSNVQINLISNFSDHPLKHYLDRGIRVTLNTDNRLLTGIRVTDEYSRAQQSLGLAWEELCTIALNGFRGAFLLEKEKGELVTAVQKEIEKIQIT